MATAKDIRVSPISSKDGNEIVRRFHYSGKVVPNSQLHLGVFLNNSCEGVMSFGPSMDKSKLQGLVKDTPWNGFIELNRMAFSDRLPKNSESRALGVAMRLMRKHYPHLQWVVSFADGTQCGDGTIYRASGFQLTQIRENKTLIGFPDGTRIATMTLLFHWDTPAVAQLCKRLGIPARARSMSEWRAVGARELPGYQFRYLYFLDPTAKDRLIVPVIPFSKIGELGVGMYRGKKRAASNVSVVPPDQGGEGGAIPTAALQTIPTSTPDE